MKKLCTLLLSLALLVTLAGCQGEKDNTPVKGNEPTQEEPQKEEPKFDTSWAKNDFEKQIPKIPEGNWQEVKDDPNVYDIISHDQTMEQMKDYVQLLQDCGYTGNPNIGDDYFEFYSTNDKGTKVNVFFYDSRKVANTVAPAQTRIQIELTK